MSLNIRCVHIFIPNQTKQCGIYQVIQYVYKSITLQSL